MEKERVLSLQELEQALDIVLGNPYREGLLARRLKLEDAGVLVSPAQAPQVVATRWRDWRARVPPEAYAMDPLGIALAVCIGGASKELVRDVPKEIRWPCLELVDRGAEVKATIDRIAGRSEAVRRLREQTWRAAFGDRLDLANGLTEFLRSTPVLVLGETGTGKELVADALKRTMPGQRGKQADDVEPAPSQTVHLASIPDGLVESALFGHVKGAFTGASAAQTGVLHRCHGGVVCLDEVAELPMRTQVALLRALESGEVLPVGAVKEVAAAPRVLSATHQPLERLMSEGQFREDLFHRLSSVVIRTPPLRARPEDISLICDREIMTIAQDLRLQVKDRFDTFLKRHRDYAWPGNVRELKKVLRALALGFNPEIRGPNAVTQETLPKALGDGTMTLEQARAWYAGHVLKRNQGNKSAAAKALGVDRGTLRNLVPEESRAS